MISPASIAANLAQIRQRIAAAADSCGRRADDVALVERQMAVAAGS